MKLSWEQCADILIVSRTTLWRKCHELGLGGYKSYSYISSSELDAVIQRLAQQYPSSGSVIIWGHLRSLGINVPRRKVRDSLLRVSLCSVEQRASTTVTRRTYSVPSSNCLWHIDGLHCLICWRIVIHGGIDGISRLVVYLSASTNNRASTVVDLFLKAAQTYGWPLRVRSDQGGENIDVARTMIMARGPIRASHIAGASVHNQRIERLLRDVFPCVCHMYYSLFYEMETLGYSVQPTICIYSVYSMCMYLGSMLN